MRVVTFGEAIALPAPMKSAELSRETPPNGTSATRGSGPRSALMYLGPTTPAGKTLPSAAPDSQTVRNSMGVSAPQHVGTPYPTPVLITSGYSVSMITRRILARSARRPASPSITVQAPMMICSSTRRVARLRWHRVSSECPLRPGLLL